MQLWLMADGRAIHVRAADTGNALSPSAEQRVVRTTSVMESSEHSVGAIAVVTMKTYIFLRCFATEDKTLYVTTQTVTIILDNVYSLFPCHLTFILWLRFVICFTEERIIIIIIITYSLLRCMNPSVKNDGEHYWTMNECRRRQLCLLRCVSAVHLGR